MHSKLAAFLLPILAVALPQSGNAPDPNQITILDTTYSGNGCPQGSVSTSTSPDKTVCMALLDLRCILRLGLSSLWSPLTIGISPKASLQAR